MEMKSKVPLLDEALLPSSQAFSSLVLCMTQHRAGNVPTLEKRDYREAQDTSLKARLHQMAKF